MRSPINLPLFHPFAPRPGALLQFLYAFLCAIGVGQGAIAATSPGAEVAGTGGLAPAAQVYQEYCAVCHGDKGDGMTRVRHGLNPPPRDFTNSVARSELTRERMVSSVTHGRPGTAMMPFDSRLNAQEITAVVDYIRDNFMLKDEVTVDEQMLRLDRGKRIYLANCAVCHGDNGNGAMWTETSLNPPPRDFTSAQSAQELSRERMLTSVTHGRPGTAMMAFGKRFSPDEIAAVVDYVRDEFLGKAGSHQNEEIARAHAGITGSKPATPAPIVAADMSQPLPNNLAGDAEKGRQFFMSNCFTCHGVEGNGNGPRSSFIHPKPRDFTSAESRLTLNRPALYRAIGIGKTGTVMPAWSKVLSDQQIADIAEFVFKEFVQPEAAPAAGPASVDEQKKKASS